jgi:hypothetical protein
MITPEWVCQRCGYRMNARDSLDNSSREPAEGDLCLCFNCCALYKQKSGSWLLAVESDLEQLGPAFQAQLEVIRKVRQAVYPGDFAFEQKHNPKSRKRQRR